jgi:hypothetical protein
MTLCIGMSGAYVSSVQRLLARLSLYRGPIDSRYGGGTYAAVKNYQIAHHLTVTGMVDAATWETMFPGQPTPVSDFANRPLCDRCLALTGSFETSSYPPESFCGLAGDSDGMGLSFGVCQWNIGQGTLQPLLQRMFEQHAELAGSIFHENFDILAEMANAGISKQLVFARSIQDKFQLIEPWRGMLLTLGRTPEFQAIQSDAASGAFKAALELRGRFGLTSERAAALMFDIITQNGSIVPAAADAILESIQKPALGSDNEVSRMVLIANSVADASAPDHAADVRSRKLTIATGAGTVHGRPYDLEEMFAIGLTSFQS